ncbi:winged helix-turn-helix domain-containing protein [Risungbinella massiliensis]|uniref:winged helix-turn-helix domain-containing protein n=1 Tax=Risungbinella massiliensis TaxID=1329796 RepID=UPI0005CC8336|nr:helix-turn-helix domain-containing protein [Risungbinella massiliensis]
MEHKFLERHIVESPEQATALMNPLRAEILSNLRKPASASEVARNINESPQRINYHLKMLEKVGLVRKIGNRQVRNLVEVLYQGIAQTYVLAESLAWSPDTIQKIKDQSSLAHLIHTSDQIKKDALLLMERSDENEEIPSASLSMKVQLRDQQTREKFVQEYVDMVKELLQKYQATQQQVDGDPYQVVLAVYPEANQEEE